MAKQIGPHYFSGKMGNLVFYEANGQQLVRAKGSYKSFKQLKKSPKYQRQVQQCHRFGEASELLRPIYYRRVPKAIRKHGLYGKLTGMVNRMLYAGRSKEEVKAVLIAYCQRLAQLATEKKAKGFVHKPCTTLPLLSDWVVNVKGRLQHRCAHTPGEPGRLNAAPLTLSPFSFSDPGGYQQPVVVHRE